MLAKERYGIRERELLETHAQFVPFTAQTRMSGVDLDGTRDPQGRGRRDRRVVRARHGPGARTPRSSGSPGPAGRRWPSPGTASSLGVIELKDIIKEGLVERFAQLRKMGIRTVMITGDNPLTAAAIAQESGVDDFLAEATPETKMALIKREQEGGVLVAMTGDGTNDAPALAQADVGRGHEHRDLGRQGGGQHGRPRLQPDQAHGHRRDRQAAAHHPRVR